MNDSQKIEELLHYFRIKTKEFAKKCGFESETISGIKRGKHKISLKIATKITEAFPEVNKTWLATGEGEMLIKSK
jgi:plasmid maintenance system antidote protein VapI